MSQFLFSQICYACKFKSPVGSPMAGLPGGRLLLPPPQLCLLRQAGSPEGQEKEEEEEVAGASSSGRRRTDQEAEHLHPAQQVRSVLPDGVNGHKVSALVAFIYYIYKKRRCQRLEVQPTLS